VEFWQFFDFILLIRFLAFQKCINFLNVFLLSKSSEKQELFSTIIWPEMMKFDECISNILSRTQRVHLSILT